MKQLTAGIVAHVDSGKTTLSEQLLFLAGEIRERGRVDHGDAFLDHNIMERERGITIFAKQAVLHLPDLTLNLLDTPGHVDFSAEMERTLSVLDFAILVISGADGVQSHTETLWTLLSRYHVPVMLFLNKMDLTHRGKEELLQELHKKLSDSCLDFTSVPDTEEIASLSEEALEEYAEKGSVSKETVQSMIQKRELFPVYFGSALRGDGVEALLYGMDTLMNEPDYPEQFGARVFKIGSDEKGKRLTYLKVTGGTLLPKQMVETGKEDKFEEKIQEIRIFSGTKYECTDHAKAGTVCAVTGLSESYAGEGLGIEQDTIPPVLEPVISYQILLPDGITPQAAFQKLSSLSGEMPETGLEWDDETKEIHVRLMGQVQTEILQRMVKDRFGMIINFGPGKIQYRETIASPVTGIGHFEPLRHYAEVHLLLSPGERGSGLVFESDCSQDVLEKNWQRLILTHLKERVHKGVLVGAPITDIKITLISGRAHLKHTEGGDFRQATYRAVRQGLKKAESVLLEPYYAFHISIPSDQIGKVMSDLEQRHALIRPPENNGETATLEGTAPVSRIYDYPKELTRISGGRGQISFRFSGYERCLDAEEVIEKTGYDSEADLRNPTGSVFCAHGAGFQVPWDEVENYMHLEDMVLSGNGDAEDWDGSLPIFAPRDAKGSLYGGTYEEDKELEAIFTREFGPIRRRADEVNAVAAPKIYRAATGKTTEDYKAAAKREKTEEYLFVDGYNVIHADPELSILAESDLGAARGRLMDILCNYQGYTGRHLIVVFDAYKVSGGRGSAEQYYNIYVVYTKENETADMYIERQTALIGKKHRVIVATSDGLIQSIILGEGAVRMSARELMEEIRKQSG